MKYGFQRGYRSVSKLDLQRGRRLAIGGRFVTYVLFVASG